MPDLSEFISFIAEKSGVEKPSLIEKDVIIHRILKEIHSSSHFAENYLFKGGSCLVKCYFGYYRFSVDLDFTWGDQNVWVEIGEKELRRMLLEEIRSFGSMLESVSKETGLEFRNDRQNRRYFEFGGSGRMVTFKLWKNSELVKIQVSFVDEVLFPCKKLFAKTLLNAAKISRMEKAYFEEFLASYKSIQVIAYDEKEILCEKVRAILTRQAQKLRDFYDLFVLDKHGFHVGKLKEEIVRKTKACLYYKKYRENLERNKKLLEATGVLEDPFEREMLVTKPSKDFEVFLKGLEGLLKDIMSYV